MRSLFELNASKLRMCLALLLGCLAAIRICAIPGIIMTGPAHGQIRSQDLLIHVKFSGPLAVYVFLTQLSAKVPDNPFKKLFQNSKFNQEPYQRLIAEFENLKLEYTYEYKEYPGKNVGSTDYLLSKNLINSQTIDEFRLGSIGIIPNDTLFKLSSLLTEFEPVYQQLVYQPNHDKFEKQLRELQALVASTNMTSYLNVGVTFYNSSWEKSIPFYFVFYPLPESQGFTATAFFNNAVSAIPTSLTNYKVLLSVMFHEIFHILYDEQSAVLKKNIQQWLRANPSRNAHYASALLNESLATALGNGYVAGKLNGKESAGNWYRRKYVNLMAKAIYPMVKDYVERQQPMDKPFLDDYINIFDENFSDWLFDPDFIMSGRYVLSDSRDDFKAIDQKFPFAPETQYEVGISATSIAKMAEAEPITRVIIVANDHKRKLELVQKAFVELKTWKPNAKADFTYSHRLDDKAYLIVINSVKKTTTEQIEALKLKESQ